MTASSDTTQESADPCVVCKEPTTYGGCCNGCGVEKEYEQGQVACSD